MRKMVICCLVLLTCFNIENVFAETEKDTTNKRKVAYILSAKAERTVERNCNNEEDAKFIEAIIAETPILKQLIKGEMNCFKVLKFFKESDLKYYYKESDLKQLTQNTQNSQFSLIESMTVSSLMTDPEFEILIQTIGTKLAERIFPKKDGWGNYLVYTRIVSNKELRDVLGSDCFYCKKEEGK